MQVASTTSIAEQYAEGAAFLWLQRNAAVREPHYYLKDLAQLDERIEANIDGLRIAGNAGWEICKEALALNEPGEVFAAAVLALEGEDGQRVDEVVQIAINTPENWRALVSATGWISDVDYQRWIPGLLTVNDPIYRRLAIVAGIIRRQDPGLALTAALDDPDPSYQARALRAVGELKRYDLLPVLQQKYQSDDALCRFWAAWSAVLLGDKPALEIIKSYATAGSPLLVRALQVMLRVMDVVSASKWLSDFTQSKEVLRQAVQGAGIIGDPLYVPWLIQMMAIPEVARVAGESFTMITGVDLSLKKLEGEWPEGFEAGPTENPEDENVTMDADEDLPWPNPGLIQVWWEKNQQSFQSGTRYLVGKPISIEHCQQVLRMGLQRQRRAAALELAILQKDDPLFNTSAPGFRQQQWLHMK